MTNPTSNFGWQMPTSTDLVTDLPADFETFGQAVDTSLADLKGGTTGQVLSKTSNTDMDFTWVTSDDANAIQNTIVDAKGDLIAASAADTPARLAVGSNGQMLVADSSTSTGLRYNTVNNQNFFINGGFDIWQRGTSFANPVGNTYTADRIVALGGGGTNTVAQETSVIPTGAQYALKITAGAASSYFNLGSVLESSMVAALAGKTVTFSILVRANATHTGTVSMTIDTGTVANSLGGTWTTQASATATPSTSAFTLMTATYAVPSNAVALRVTFNQTALQASGAIVYWGKGCIEIGSVATEFSRAGGTIQGELAACQRYYWRQTAAGNAYSKFGLGVGNGATDYQMSITNPVAMRVPPTSVDSSSLAILDGVAIIAVSAVALNAATNLIGGISATGTGFTAGRGGTLIANNNTAAYIGFNAEL